MHPIVGKLLEAIGTALASWGITLVYEQGQTYKTERQALATIKAILTQASSSCAARGNPGICAISGGPVGGTRPFVERHPTRGTLEQRYIFNVALVDGGIVHLEFWDQYPTIWWNRFARDGERLFPVRDQQLAASEVLEKLYEGSRRQLN